MLKRVVASATTVASPNSAEGVLLTLPPAPLPNDPSGLVVQHTVIDGVLNFLAGATGVTAVVVRVRRGSLAGALVGVAQTHTLAAAGQASIAFAADDPASANPAVGQVYVVTIQQTGGTAAGSMVYGVATTTIS